MSIATQYRRNSLEGKSNAGLTVLLYDRLVTTLYSGLGALEAGEVELRGKQFKHAISILGHLQATLDFAAGGEVAKSLNKFYGTAMVDIVRAAALCDGKTIKQLIGQVAAVSEAWREVERQERPRPR